MANMISIGLYYLLFLCLSGSLQAFLSELDS